MTRLFLPRFRTHEYQTPSLPAGLASVALISVALLANAQPLHAAGSRQSCGVRRIPFCWQLACRPNAQSADFHALLTAVHEVTSYNGDEQTAITNLVGRDAIIAFFASSATFNKNWVGLTPSFRTQVEMHGNTAEVYLECDFVDETKQIVSERALHGTVRTVGGHWLFWKCATIRPSGCSLEETANVRSERHLQFAAPDGLSCAALASGITTRGNRNRYRSDAQPG